MPRLDPPLGPLPKKGGEENRIEVSTSNKVNNMTSFNKTILTCLCLVGAFSTIPLFAQRDLTKIPDSDPQKEKATFKLPEGFEINLFASDPQIAKPIQMNWDAQGRLWVASSSAYPMLKPGEVANDKIVILEDTTGDGKADKTINFADGLLIPTAVMPGDGGVYVANSTELIHLSDTNGDGKADKKRVVLAGFGTEDTHHLVHTLRWGPDGRLYFNQSIYIHSHIETPWGVRRLKAGGIWRFNPKKTKLKVYARGFVNPWGHQFDKWGQSFVTDGAFGEGINYVFPEAAYVLADGSKRILHGLNPGQPKHCGIEILSGRHLPDDWQGTMIANDFRGNRVNRFRLKEEGSGYISRQEDDVITSNHVAFRPIDVKMGPDGAIYIADWYNPIIQHGEVDFRDKRRDHTHGRIWRITAKGRPLVKKPKLVGAPIIDVLNSLKLPEDWTRQQAKRVLHELGAKKVTPELQKWINGLESNDKVYQHHLLEGLWVFQSLDIVNDALLKKLLQSEDHRVRAAAVRVLSDWMKDISETNGLLTKAIQDKHPRVRLEAIHALRLLGTADAAKIAIQAVDQPMDNFVDFALELAMRKMQSKWLPKLQANADFFGTKKERLIYALKSSDQPAAITLLTRLYLEHKVQKKDEQKVLQLIASRGTEADITLLYERSVKVWLSMTEGSARFSVEFDRITPILNALEIAAKRKIKPKGGLRLVRHFLEPRFETSNPTAARLIGHWKVTHARKNLVEIINTKTKSEKLRHAAIEGLALLGGKQNAEFLSAAVKSNRPQTQMVLIAAIAKIDIQQGAAKALVFFKNCPPEVDSSPLFQALLQAKGGIGHLTHVLKDQKILRGTALTGLGAINTSGRKMPKLEAVLRKAGGSIVSMPKLSAEQFKKLVSDISTKGNAKRGEAIYRRTSNQCITCHAIGGAGGLVGPDLSSIGASAQIDYLVESMLEPSKKIKEGYHTIKVVTLAGLTKSGTLVQKTKEHIKLRDAKGTIITILTDDIDEQLNSPVSLMPKDQMASLRRDEMVDLIKFMSRLGKEGDFKVSKSRLVRRWRLLKSDQQISRLIRSKGAGYATNNDEKLIWLPQYSLTNGELPLSDQPDIAYFFGAKFSFARFHMDVKTAGKIALKFNTTAGIKLWVGEKEIKVTENNTVQFPIKASRQTITMMIDKKKRNQPLHVELIDVPDSKGQAEIIRGQ